MQTKEVTLKRYPRAKLARGYLLSEDFVHGFFDLLCYLLDRLRCRIIITTTIVQNAVHLGKHLCHNLALIKRIKQTRLSYTRYELNAVHVCIVFQITCPLSIAASAIRQFPSAPKSKRMTSRDKSIHRSFFFPGKRRLARRFVLQESSCHVFIICNAGRQLLPFRAMHHCVDT